MEAPKFEIVRTQRDGKVSLEVIVRNSLANPELHAECERLGLVPTVDISNRRSITVTTAAELDAVREPLRRFFAVQS